MLALRNIVQRGARSVGKLTENHIQTRCFNGRFTGDVNQVTLIGNLGRDPYIHQTEEGTTFAKFSLATNWIDSQDNKHVDWHDVYLPFRSQANLAETLMKGEKVMVIGQLNYRKLIDRDDPDRTYTVAQIRADKIFPIRKPEFRNDNEYFNRESDN